MCVMSLECVNALDKLDCVMVVSICPGFVCLSRVSLVADTLLYQGPEEICMYLLLPVSAGIMKVHKITSSD